MKIIYEVVQELEAKLRQLNKEREDSGVFPFGKAEIKVLGQMSLIMNEQAAKVLPLAFTMDLDAVIKGAPVARQELVSILKTKGLVLDDLSNEIWLPSDHTFIDYYDSDLLKVTYLDPISALTSKAIKAREKNRFLIKAALSSFGKELKEKIEFYGGDIKYFTEHQKAIL